MREFLYVERPPTSSGFSHRLTPYHTLLSVPFHSSLYQKRLGFSFPSAGFRTLVQPPLVALVSTRLTFPFAVDMI